MLLSRRKHKSGAITQQCAQRSPTVFYAIMEQMELMLTTIRPLARPCASAAAIRPADLSFARTQLTRSLLAMAALVAALLSGAEAARAEAPATYLQRVANELIAASRKGGSQQAFASVIRKHADVPYIGMASLGDYARGLAPTDRPSYFSGLVNFIGRYAASQAPKYPVASAIVTSQTAEDKNGVYVDSRVTLASGDYYDVRWWLVRSGASFKVRDAQVAGFWMSPFLRSYFEDYIGNNGGNPKALVVALNR